MSLLEGFAAKGLDVSFEEGVADGCPDRIVVGLLVCWSLVGKSVWPDNKSIVTLAQVRQTCGGKQKI